MVSAAAKMNPAAAGSAGLAPGRGITVRPPVGASLPRIEALGPSFFISNDDLIQYDSDGMPWHGPGHRRGEREEAPPFYALFAAAYQVNEIAPESRSGAFLRADARRGVGIYEFNMGIFAGKARAAGSVLNRLY